MPIIRNCKHCGKEFNTWPSRIAKGEGNYCSHSCIAKDNGFKKGYTPYNKGTRGTNTYIAHGRRIITFPDGTKTYYARYIMEQHLGRKLSSREQVHHKDENKLNDVIENLEVLSIEEHASLHSTGKVYLNRRKREEVVCLNCSKEFEIKRGKVRKTNFCSVFCRSFYLNRAISPNGRFIKLSI